jgi:hypothetical protein
MDAVEGEVLAVELIAAVIRGVIDDDCEVVGVVLQEDGVEVELDAELGVVVVAGHHDAHRNLLIVTVQAMNTPDSLVLHHVLAILLIVDFVAELNGKFAQT